MIRFALFLLMSLAVSSQVAAGVKNEKEPLNIFVPDDVFEIFQNASPTIKAKHCSAFNEHPYQEIVRLSQNPPKRIFGYNLSLIHI